MVFATSSHRAEHWWFFDGGMALESDVRDPANAGLYGPAAPAPTDTHNTTEAGPNAAFMDDWLARTCEIVDKYRPQIVWFDWWINHAAFEPYLRRFAAYYYNRGVAWGRGVAINYKYEAFPPGAAVFDIERGQCGGLRGQFWQTDTSVSRNSWGYVAEQDYKTPGDLVGDLVDIVSKNGALLLNVGPRPDGTIPEPERELLLAIGRWLAVNGEAIYGTRPWVTYGEGPTEVREGAFTDTERRAYTPEDIRFTMKGDLLYAIMLGWPEGGVVRIRSLREGCGPDSIRSVSMLGSDTTLTWRRESDALVVPLPERRPCEHAWVLKVAMG